MHAHLSGCLRAETFLELAEKNGVDVDHIDFYNVKIDTAFEIFRCVGRMITNLSVVERVTKECIEDYAKHNTAYLELRTSPKDFSDGNTTKE